MRLARAGSASSRLRRFYGSSRGGTTTALQEPAGCGESMRTSSRFAFTWTNVEVAKAAVWRLATGGAEDA